MEEDYNMLFIGLGSVILITVIFECIILGIAFFGADRVECNMFGCTFITERVNQSDSIIIETHKICFLNGYEIDCNDNRTSLPRIVTGGNFDSNPVFKYDADWKDILRKQDE